MEIISMANRKGGVGKTTLSYNLGHMLAHMQNRTLLIDMDSQGSLTQVMGIPFKLTIYDVLTGQCKMEEAIKEHSEFLHIVPTHQELENIDLQFANTKGREGLLKRALETVKSSYDYIVIDTTPATNLSMVNSLTASTQVIVPVNADYLSYDGLQKFTEVINLVQKNLNPDLEFRGVITNSVRNSNHSREIAELLRKTYRVLAELKLSVVVMDSTVENKPLFVHSPQHYNTGQLIKLYKEVTK